MLSVPGVSQIVKIKFEAQQWLAFKKQIQVFLGVCKRVLKYIINKS